MSSRNQHLRPQVVFAAIVAGGGLLAWLLPRSVEGKFLLFGLFVVAATVAFALLSSRERRARAELEAQRFLEQAMAEVARRKLEPSEPKA